MATFAKIRDGLKKRLDTIPDLNTYDTIPEGFTPPAAVVGGPMGKEFQINYVTRGGPKQVAEWILPIWISVGALDAETAQNLLDQYIDSTGTRSIKKAIEGDQTLDGSAQAVRITKVENYTGITCEFRVEVLA